MSAILGSELVGQSKMRDTVKKPNINIHNLAQGQLFDQLDGLAARVSLMARLVALAGRLCLTTRLGDWAGGPGMTAKLNDSA